MHLPSNTETSKASKIILIVGFAIVLTGAGVYLFWDDAPPPRVAVAAPIPVAAPEAAPEITALTAPISGGDYLNAPSDLRELTELQSTLELKKLEVAIGEQNARLSELQGGAASAITPQIVATPDQPAPDVQSTMATERVLSIQGLGGAIMATVDTPEGLRTIKVGDNFAFGQVTRISALGVEIREGENLRLISVEE